MEIIFLEHTDILALEYVQIKNMVKLEKVL
jgi:hypothetical protein